MLRALLFTGPLLHASALYGERTVHSTVALYGFVVGCSARLRARFSALGFGWIAASKEGPEAL